MLVTRVGWPGAPWARGWQPATTDHVLANDPERRTDMASAQMIRVDAYGLLPSILIVLMSILAILGVVAHSAAL